MLGKILVFEAFGVATLLLGGAMVYGARRRHIEATKISNTETTPIADIRPDDHRVEVKGTGRPTDAGTIQGCIEGTAGMLVHTVVEEWQNTENSGGHWDPIHEGVEALPFLVEDDTGTARVEIPDGADVVTDQVRRTVETDSDTPPGIEQYLLQTDGLSRRHSEKRRYDQGVIEPGEDVYVLAERTTRSGWDSSKTLLTGETHPERVTVSDLSESDLIGRKRTEARKWYLIGACVLCIGIGFVVLPLL